jgi:hypothetical protein
MSYLSNGTKKHTSKSRETIPLRENADILSCLAPEKINLVNPDSVQLSLTVTLIQFDRAKSSRVSFC